MLGGLSTPCAPGECDALSDGAHPSTVTSMLGLLRWSVVPARPHLSSEVRTSATGGTRSPAGPAR